MTYSLATHIHIWRADELVEWYSPIEIFFNIRCRTKVYSSCAFFIFLYWHVTFCFRKSSWINMPNGINMPDGYKKTYTYICHLRTWTLELLLIRSKILQMSRSFLDMWSQRIVISIVHLLSISRVSPDARLFKQRKC